MSPVVAVCARRLATAITANTTATTVSAHELAVDHFCWSPGSLRIDTAQLDIAYSPNGN